MPRTKKQLKEIRDKTTSQILDSALDLFASTGFHGTTIQDIAKKAKISKGLIYNYFKTKDEILETLFKQKFTFAEELIKKISHISDPYQKIDALIDAETEEIKSKEKLYRLFYAGALLPKNTEKIRTMCAKFSKKMEKIHKELSAVLIGDKSFAEDKKNEIMLLRACLLGMMVGYLINPGNFNIDVLTKIFKKKIREH